MESFAPIAGVRRASSGRSPRSPTRRSTFRATIWTDTQTGYALEEATEPRHLLIDAVLRHSIGR
jgi:hypothetical protein